MPTGTADRIDLCNGTASIACPSVGSDDGELEALLLVMVHKIIEKVGIPLIREKAGIFVIRQTNDIITKKPTTIVK
eukprot:3955930-Heterocapsa_arctica.AAC.1